MAPRLDPNMQRPNDNSESPTYHRPVHEAVARFGQLAVDQQKTWIIDTVLKLLKGRYSTRSYRLVTSTKTFLDGNVIIPHEIRSREIHQHRRSPQHTCALPICPDFNQPMDAGAHCILIEKKSNLHLADKFYRPTASLAAVRTTPIGGELNLRGRGETGSFHFHVACGELVLSRGAYVRIFRSHCPPCCYPDLSSQTI